MKQMIAPAHPSPYASDEYVLSLAIDLLSQNRFLRPLLASAISGGYEFAIDPALHSKAAHRPKTKSNPNPSMRFPPGRSCAQYAESLCHELIHFAITCAGRIYGVQMTPIADIEMRQCEEAAVFAITSDIMYQAAHGINMKDKKAYPELWEANLGSSCYTAKAYSEHASVRSLAVREAFESFYTLPDERFRESYQAYSINSILGETKETLTNPSNFTEDFNPEEFGKFLPAPYNKILGPCLAAMKSRGDNDLILTLPLAKDIEDKFVTPRRSVRCVKPDWTIRVKDEDRCFLWSPVKGSLMRQRNQVPVCQAS